MGLYYNPPQPFMGARQPGAPLEQTPPSGPTPQNPPFMGGARVPQAVLDAWRPPPPSVMFDDAPITFPLGAPNPPQSTWFKLSEALTDWLPPQPGQVLFLLAPASTPPAPRPPIREYWSAQVEITTAWIPGPPGPYLQAQPYAQEVTVPPISGEVAANPPFNGGAKVPFAVLTAWIPPPPQAPVAVLLDPPISADFVSGQRPLDVVRELWEALPPMAIVLEAPIPSSSDSPIAASAIPQAVLNAWLPRDPMAITSTLGRLPSSSDRPIPRGVPEAQAWYPAQASQVLFTASPISTPPPLPPPVIGSEVPQAELNAWIKPDPLPQTARNIVPFIGPEPPHPNRIPLAVLNAWLPPQPQPIVAKVLASPFSADFPIKAVSPDLQAWAVSALAPVLPSISAPPGVGGIQLRVSVPDGVIQAWDAVPPAAIILEIPIPPSADQPVIGSPIPRAVLNSWIPPDPMPDFVNEGAFLQSGPAPTAAPFLRSIVEIVDAWLPAQAEPYLAAQPYAIEVTVPPISGPTPTNPPFAGGAAVPRAVLLSWLLPPPDQVLRLRPAASTPPALPPPVIGSQVPPAVLVSWQLPAPLPMIVITAPQGAAAPSNPPPVRGGANVFLDAWAPAPPRPIVEVELASPVSADQPPIGTKVPDGVLQAWTVPAPAPILPALPTPPSADRPPPLRPLQYLEPVFTPIALAKAVLSAPLPQPVMAISIWNAWLPPDPVQPAKAVYLALPAPIINAPIPNSSQFWSIYAGWISVQPQPIFGSSVITLLQPSFILNPNLIATVQPRRMVATIVSRTMARTNDLGPPIDSTVEQETVTFDFGPLLAPGVVITSIVSLTCVVYAGRDPAPSTRLIGASALGPSPKTFANTTAVYQLVGNMVGGVTYRLQCVVKTSDGQTPSGYTHLECKTPD